MKKLNNKGFSLIELLGVMVILSLILVAGVAQYRKYIKQVTDDAYNLMAESLEAASDNYFIDHPFAESVTVDELVEGNYIEAPDDPSRKADTDDTCSGKIRRKISDEETGSDSLETSETSVSLCCKDYTYTYKYPGEVRMQDKYCKALPYDIKKIKNIKVLNVYPYHSSAHVTGDQLKGWMDTYGKGLIQVTPVYILDFNKAPEKYLGTEGKWNYDEVVFGFVDCNGSQDLSKEAAELVDQYLNTGGAAIFGHDTLTRAGCGNHTNFNTLAKHVNMDLNGWHQYASGTKVNIVRSGIFTEYPYKIGDVGTELTIPKSHVYGQVAHGDVWITFNGEFAEEDKVYLSTYGNNAFIQTGHSNGNATADEQKIIANIIFYMVAKQYSED